MNRTVKFFAPLLFALALLSGCGGGSGTVSLSMKIVSGRGGEELVSQGRAMQTDSRSFTPTSFKLPIMKISVSKANGSDAQTLYTCPKSTEAECLVDLASQTELDVIKAAAASKSIPQDTYDMVSVNTCVEGASGTTATTAKVTGSGTGPNGSTWTTHATNVVTTNGTGTAAELDVGNWSCSTKSVIVKGGIVVAADALTLTVVVDNYMGAVFGNTVSPGMGGCKSSAGASVGTGLCMTYPALMAYVGSDTATTKRFAISHDKLGAPDATKANALIIVAVTATGGTPLMAFGRTLFTSTSESVATNTKAQSILDPNYSLNLGGPTYVTSTNFETFTVNASGTIAFEQGGSEDTFAAKYTDFDTSKTHSGTMTSKDGGDTWNYLATLL